MPADDQRGTPFARQSGHLRAELRAVDGDMGEQRANHGRSACSEKLQGQYIGKARSPFVDIAANREHRRDLGESVED
jgi:hypothetical protein